MRTYSFYHKETGVIHPQCFSTDGGERTLKANTPADHIAVEAALDRLSQRVDVASGAVIDFQPPQPSNDHEWNADTKRWVLKPQVVEAKAKQRAIKAQITALEARQARAVREALCGDNAALERLRTIDEAINQLRSTLAT